MYKISYKGFGSSKDNLLTAIETYSNFLVPIFGDYSRWLHRVKSVYIDDLPLIRDGYSEFNFYKYYRTFSIYFGEYVLNSISIGMKNSNKALFIREIEFEIPNEEFDFTIHFKDGIPDVNYYDYMEKYLYKNGVRDERCFVNGKSAIDKNLEFIKYFEEHVENSIFKIFIKI